MVRRAGWSNRGASNSGIASGLWTKQLGCCDDVLGCRFGHIRVAEILFQRGTGNDIGLPRCRFVRCFRSRGLGIAPRAEIAPSVQFASGPEQDRDA
jgi:hypothetical protein